MGRAKRPWLEDDSDSTDGEETTVGASNRQQRLVVTPVFSR